MALAVIYSRGRSGIDAPLVTVEVHVANGLPSMSIVGLPETAVKESKDRVRGAIINSRFDFPAQRITVNLAPADLPKEGGRFDLAIALGILAASGQIPADQLSQYECVGELSLGGDLRAINGVLPIAIQVNGGATETAFADRERGGSSVGQGYRLNASQAFAGNMRSFGRTAINSVRILRAGAASFGYRSGFCRCARPVPRQAGIRDCSGRRS